jgi:hypothetical protein
MALTYRQCQEYQSPPITPATDERNPVPLSPITEPSTGGSSMDHSPADPTFKESPQPLGPLTHSEDSERNCISTLQKPDPMKPVRDNQAMMYLLSDGIILQKGDIYHVYQDKSYIPSRTRQIPDNNIDYPYGWSAGIEEYCQLFGHHPDCTDPIRRTFIEREFVNYTINDPNRFGALDNYLNIIYANSLGRNLQWLFSSNTPVPDDLQQRTEITNLYAQIDNQEGSIYHTKHGLRITIPKEKWINWKTFSPTSQSEFTRAAWAQLTQFDKMALMTGLKEGKLDKKPIYIDFGDNAKHDQFWQTEFDSVHQYYIELITQMGTFHSFNQYVVQDLAYNNEPLDIDLNTNWEMEDRPKFIFLPYSKLMVRWNGKQHQWEIEEHSTNGLSSGSSYTRSSQGSMMSTSPFNDPIDEFEMVDRDMD